MLVFGAQTFAELEIGDRFMVGMCIYKKMSDTEACIIQPLAMETFKPAAPVTLLRTIC